jgi:hypothetical protein
MKHVLFSFSETYDPHPANWFLRRLWADAPLAVQAELAAARRVLFS